jgi:CheY-like chemotaxis protein
MPPAILLAEDQESDTLLLQRAFKTAGIVNPLHAVSDGEQCLAYLRGGGEYSNRAEYPLPSLLLLDLKMPRMSGFEVLSWIRAQPELKDLRIVVFSASLEPMDVNRAVQLGANSFLVKPINFDDLVAMVRVLGRLAMKRPKA